MDIQDRARGVMLGLACGDALGAPVEFMSKTEIAARYPDGMRDFTHGGWMNVVEGELTDDSRMAIDLAEVLARPGDPDMDALGASFVAWVAEGPKDVGNTTKIAIDHLAAGVPWSKAGYLALETRGERGASSNGSLMRTAPVAIRYRNDPEALVDVSRNTSLITHAEERCQWSCVALNQGIAYLLGGGSLDGLVEAAVQGIPVGSVVETVRNAPQANATSLSGTGFVLNGLAVAFWAVMTTTSLEDAISAAVMIGDDTDTNAAIAGSLGGAFYGASALPDRWLAQLHQRDRLVSLADQLALLGDS